MERTIIKNESQKEEKKIWFKKISWQRCNCSSFSVSIPTNFLYTDIRQVVHKILFMHAVQIYYFFIICKYTVVAILFGQYLTVLVATYSHHWYWDCIQSITISSFEGWKNCFSVVPFFQLWIVNWRFF